MNIKVELQDRITQYGTMVRNLDFVIQEAVTKQQAYREIRDSLESLVAKIEKENNNATAHS